MHFSNGIGWSVTTCTYAEEVCMCVCSYPSEREVPHVLWLFSLAVKGGTQSCFNKASQGNNMWFKDQKESKLKTTYCKIINVYFRGVFQQTIMYYYQEKIHRDGPSLLLPV